jgi:hypothetical protein
MKKNARSGGRMGDVEAENLDEALGYAQRIPEPVPLPLPSEAGARQGLGQRL